VASFVRSGTVRAKNVDIVGTTLRFFIAFLLLALIAVPADGAPYAYIPNLASNDVSVIDTSTDTVVATVPVGNRPSTVAVHPAGTRAYIGRLTDVGQLTGISVIDATSNFVIATMPGGIEPSGIAVNPQGSRLYATDSFANQVRVIDTKTNVLISTIPVDAPTGVAVSPDGGRVYVASNALAPVTLSGSLWVINAATNTIGAIVDLGFNTGGYGVAVHPDGTHVYVARDDNLSVVDTSTNMVTARVKLGLYQSTGVAVNPSGTRVYVAGVVTYTGGGQVSVVDTTTNSVVAKVPVGNSAEGAAVHPDGTRLYVANRFPGTVTVISTSNNSILATVAVGREPIAFGAFIGPLPPVAAAAPIPTITRGMLIATMILLAAAAYQHLRRHGLQTWTRTHATGPDPEQPLGRLQSSHSKLLQRTCSTVIVTWAKHRRRSPLRP
jgi:YVTN family beta-propeller protein